MAIVTIMQDEYGELQGIRIGPEPDRLPTLAQIKRVAILQRLLVMDGNRKRTAESLAIGVRTLQLKLKEYAVE